MHKEYRITKRANGEFVVESKCEGWPTHELNSDKFYTFEDARLFLDSYLKKDKEKRDLEYERVVEIHEVIIPQKDEMEFKMRAIMVEMEKLNKQIDEMDKVINDGRKEISDKFNEMQNFLNVRRKQLLQMASERDGLVDKLYSLREELGNLSKEYRREND